MKLFLDTHTLIWWLNDNSKLSATARAAIANPGNDVFVSAATAWELATKVRRGRLPEAARIVADLHELLDQEEFEPLMVTTRHGLIAGALAGSHNNPFDRMLVAQAESENMSIITIDPAIAALGSRTVW